MRLGYIQFEEKNLTTMIDGTVVKHELIYLKCEGFNSCCKQIFYGKQKIGNQKYDTASGG